MSHRKTLRERWNKWRNDREMRKLAKYYFSNPQLGRWAKLTPEECQEIKRKMLDWT